MPRKRWAQQKTNDFPDFDFSFEKHNNEKVFETLEFELLNDSTT